MHWILMIYTLYFSTDNKDHTTYINNFRAHSLYITRIIWKKRKRIKRKGLLFLLASLATILRISYWSESEFANLSIRKMAQQKKKNRAIFHLGWEGTLRPNKLTKRRIIGKRVCSSWIRFQKFQRNDC